MRLHPARVSGKDKITLTTSQAGTQVFDSPAEGIAQPLRVNLRPPERLVGVNVPEPRHNVLIEKQRLQLPAAGAKQTAQRFHSERWIQRLHAKPGQDDLRIRRVQDAAEFTRIVEAQFPLVVEK
jgi:hypothetical protein